MLFRVFAALIVLLLLSARPCCAGPPYAVDDPDTVAYRHYEINAAFVSSQVPGNEVEQAPSIETNYGYNNRVELVLTMGAISDRNTGEERQTGLDDTYLEGKWRVQDETPSKPELALDFRTKVPTASRGVGGTGDFDENPEVIAGKTYRSLSFFGNLGVTFPGNRDETNNIYWGVAGTYQTSEKLALGGQVYGNGSAAPGEVSELAYGVGLQYEYMAGRSYMMTVGRSARGLSDLNIYAGIQLELGPGEK